MSVSVDRIKTLIECKRSDVHDEYRSHFSRLLDAAVGSAEVDTIQVPEDDFSQFIAMVKSGRAVPGGSYRRLKVNREVMMSDTPDELNDMIDLRSQVRRRAGQTALVTGLGLGCTVSMMAKHLSEITVVERNPDVIKLIQPAIKAAFGDRVKIVEADAFEFRPMKGARFGIIWHDIWPTIGADNLDGMRKLKMRYRSRLVPGGHQSCWLEHLCRELE